MNIEIIPIEKKYEPLLELYPPVLANKILPEWYKEQPLGTKINTRVNTNRPTKEPFAAKKCPAIQDILTTGFVIPLWGELTFKTFFNDEGKAYDEFLDFSVASAYGDNISSHISYHNIEQTKGMDINRTLIGNTLKISLPYKIIVPEGYNIMYTDPFYHFRKDIRCLSGIVEADKWGFITFPFENLKSEYLIEAGTPLVHCFIYKREDKFNLITRKGTDDEYYIANKELLEVSISRKNYKTK